jgi:small subunit ribosomal protein S18
MRQDKKSARKRCYFSVNRIERVNYKDAALLRRFLTEHGKILPARITGLCPRFQRQLTVAVKRARQAGLLPYTFS